MKTNQKMCMLFAVAASMVMGACSDDDIATKSKVEVKPAVISVNSYAVEDQKLTVTANCDWSVTSDTPTWLTVTPSEGNGNKEVTVTIADNTGEDQRTANIVFTSTDGKAVATVKVTQNEPGNETRIIAFMPNAVDPLDIVYVGAFQSMWAEEAGILVEINVDKDDGGTLIFDWNIVPDAGSDDYYQKSGAGYMHSFFSDQRNLAGNWCAEVLKGVSPHIFDDGVEFDDYGITWNHANGNTPLAIDLYNPGTYYFFAKVQDRYLYEPEKNPTPIPTDFTVKLEVSFNGAATAKIYKPGDSLPE